MPMQNFEITQFNGLVLQRSSAAGQGTLIELTNAVCEIEGIIRSRSGASRINTTQLSDGAAGTNVHSSILYGDTRYTAVSTVLKRGYETAHPTIISGLNGKRISFVHMSPSVAATSKKFMYFSNGEAACRKKDDGTTTFNFGMDGPVASEIVAITPTVSAASQPSTTTIDAFASAYTAQDGFGTEAAALEPYATSARSFSVPTAKNERFRRTGLTLNLSGSGEDGFIRIMLRCDNRQNLDHVELALSSDAGAFTTDFYTYRIAALDFTEDNSWQEFKIPKNVFERVKPTGGSADTWAVIDGVQITVGANVKGPVVISADDARLEADTHPDGTYDYKITLWNDTLKTPSNARRLADIYSGAAYTTAQVTVHRQRVTIARPSGFASWDVQASHWEVWRRNVLVGDGKWHFHSRATVATTVINDDLNELAVGEALFENNHIPPPSKFILGPYDNRCFFFGMSNVTSGSTEEEAPYSFRWSEAGYPESVPFTNYGFAGDPTDTIQGGCMWAGNIYLWTKARVYEVSGRQGSYVAIPTEAPVGTTSPYTIATSPYGIFYRGLDGIYLFSGGTSTNISLEIAPVFQSGTVVIDGLTTYAMDATTIAKSENVVGAFMDDRYTLAYTDLNGVRTTIWYHVPTKRWHRAQNTTANSGWNIQCLGWMKVSGTTDQADNLEGGSSDGWLMNFHSYVNNPGLFVDGGSAAIPFAVQLKAWDSELKSTDVETDIKDIVLDVDTGSQTLTVQASFDGASYTTIGTVSTAARDKVYLPVNGGVGTIAFRCSVRITGSLSTARVTLWGVGTTHIPEPKRMLDSSTDYDQQGWPAEKILQELQIEANTFSTNVVVTVEIDGTDYGTTFTLNTTTRKMQVFSFPIENPRGTNLRLKWNGTVESKVYGYQFQFLKEPLSVVKLETEVTDLEWPAEKILQQLQITANTHGVNVTVVVEADGVDLTQTFTLNTTTHRDQVFSFNIENARATNLRLKMTGSAYWLYYKHEFQYLKEPLSVFRHESAVSDEEWPGEKIFQELSLFANTHGQDVTVIVELDGVNLIQQFVLNTTVHREQVFSFNVPHPRGTHFRLKMSCSTQWLFYKYVPQFLKEPISITQIQTQVEFNSWSGPKIFLEGNVEIDTHGIDVTASLLIDNVIRQTKTVNTTNHTTDTIEMTSSPEGRASVLRLVSPTATPFLYYGWTWVRIVKLPDEVTSWDSSPLVIWGGKKGWLGSRSQFVVKGASTITAQLIMDNVVRATLTIPAQGMRSAVLVMVPPGVTGKIAQIKLSSAAPFQIFPDGSYISAHPYDRDRESPHWEFVKSAA